MVAIVVIIIIIIIIKNEDQIIITVCETLEINEEYNFDAYHRPKRMF